MKLRKSDEVDTVHIMSQSDYSSANSTVCAFAGLCAVFPERHQDPSESGIMV